MLMPFSRDRRAMERSEHTRFHCDPAAGSRIGTQLHAMLAGAAWRHGRSQRSADAMADRKCPLGFQRPRPARTGAGSMGCRIVSRAGFAAWSLEHRA